MKENAKWTASKMSSKHKICRYETLQMNFFPDDTQLYRKKEWGGD
jgi:hypothetical protein